MYRRRLEILSVLLDDIGCDPRGKSVLEVGCGTGFYTAWFDQRQVASYTGVDITPVSVERLKVRFPRFQFIEADVSSENLRFDQQADIVMVADVLFHIVDDAKFEAALATMAQALKPGGWLILSDVLPGETYQSAVHVRYRSLSRYRQLLADRGLDTREIRPVFGLLQPPPYIPGAPLLWRLYARTWQYGLYRFGRLRLFDRLIPPLLAALDQRVVLARIGVTTPNTKWLVAARRHAA